MSFLFAFSGSSHVGKTALSRRLAETRGWKFASFGDTVRNEALGRGTDRPSRTELQDLGDTLAASNMTDLCRRVLERASLARGENLVIDGIRHLEALHCLKLLLPDYKIMLIHVEAEPHIRKARANVKEPTQDISKTDAHPVERQLAKIKEQANFVVDNSACVDHSFDFLSRWIDSLCIEAAQILARH